MRVLRGCRVWMGVDRDRGPRSSPPGGGLVVPSLTSLAKLAAALDVTVADLVIGDSKRGRLYELTRSMGGARGRGGPQEGRRPRWRSNREEVTVTEASCELAGLSAELR
jgi:hypothetical protein